MYLAVDRAYTCVYSKFEIFMYRYGWYTNTFIYIMKFAYTDVECTNSSPFLVYSSNLGSNTPEPNLVAADYLLYFRFFSALV